MVAADLDFDRIAQGGEAHQLEGGARHQPQGLRGPGGLFRQAQRHPQGPRVPGHEAGQPGQLRDPPLLAQGRAGVHELRLAGPRGPRQAAGEPPRPRRSDALRHADAPGPAQRRDGVLRVVLRAPGRGPRAVRVPRRLGRAQLRGVQLQRAHHRAGPAPAGGAGHGLFHPAAQPRLPPGPAAADRSNYGA